MKLTKEIHIRLKKIWKKILDLSDIKKALTVCAISILFIFMRRPELLINAQFWAEDFAVFYQDAYRYGANSFTHDYSGLLQTFQRLIAFIFQPIPLLFMPLAYNLVATLIMVLPLFILWSDEKILEQEGPKAKVLVSILYLLLPNVGEIYGNLTNTIWYLALAALLVLIRNSKNNRWLAFDLIIIVMAGLSGPFAPLLVVVGVFLLFARRTNGIRNKGLWLKTCILIVCACVQIGIYASAPKQRTASLINQKRSIITSYEKPIHITGMRLFVVPVLGKDAVTEKISLSPQTYLLGLLAIIITLVGFIKSRLEVKAMILFATLVYATSLLRAQTVPIVQFWDMLLFNSFGARYFFIPLFVWIVLLTSLTHKSKNKLAKVSSIIIGLYIVFFPFSFGVEKLKEYNFASQVQEFEKGQSDKIYCFDINPDESWKTCLKKK